MAKQKEERIQLDIITPAGTAVWPKLNAPDEYKGKRTFNTKLVIDPEANALLGKDEGNLVEAAHAMRDKFVEETKAALKAQAATLRKEKKGAKAKEVEAKIATIEAVDFGKPEIDDETEEETGKLVISAKTNAEYKDRKSGRMRERSLTIFDAAGKKLKNPPDIGSGSTLKLAATMVPYYMPAENTVGVTLYLNAVQIIDLVTFGGQRDAGSYGFGAEDGYRGSDEENEEEEDGEDVDDDKPNF